ncbi:MAG: ATP-binding cassette domain-containing protein, partial [Burkholderiaceae bacterium]
MNDGPLLAVDGLSVRVGNRLLLRDLGFVLQAGEALVVLGESGAGKSLLAQAIVGTLPEPLRAGGNVVLAGIRSAAGHSAARRAAWGRELVLLPQEPTLALDPLVPIGEQARRLRRLVGGETPALARTRVDAAMRDHGLAPAIGRYPWQLSGGMAQRASTLLARCGGAHVLVADEPT